MIILILNWDGDKSERKLIFMLINMQLWIGEARWLEGYFSKAAVVTWRCIVFNKSLFMDYFFILFYGMDVVWIFTIGGVEGFRVW